MSCLDKLRYFFRLCQFIGILPFRMDDDKITGRFKKFSYSWKYPISWWHITTSVASIISAVLILEETFKNSDIEDLPLIVKITIKTIITLYVVLILLSRYILLFKFHTLCKAIQFMQRIETYITVDHPKNRNNIQLRTILGLIFLYSPVAFSLFVTLRISYSPLVLRYGYGWTFVFSGFAAQSLFASCCPHMLLYLISYQMSHFIYLLRFQLLDSASGTEDYLFHHSITPTRLQERMKLSRRCFGYICCATAKWNNIFSFPLLFVLTKKIITIACGLFGFIQGFLIDGILFSGVHWLFLSFCAIDGATLLLLFLALDGPVQETARFKESLIRLCNSHLMNSTDEIIQGMKSKGYIREDRLRLSTGLFTVGVHLIPAIAESIVTYMVILFQAERRQFNEAT